MNCEWCGEGEEGRVWTVSGVVWRWRGGVGVDCGWCGDGEGERWDLKVGSMSLP